VTGVARGLGIERLVFASTCSVYGESEGWVDETSTLEPVSLYARTKADSERFLLDAPLGDFTPVVLRFGTLYGASPRVRFDLVVNLLLAKALSEGEITIFGGTQWRPLIDVADGARAIVSCLEAPADLVRGQVFNVGADDQNYTMADIGRAIADLVPGTHLVLEVEREREASYRVSSAKIHEMLGFVPTYSLRDGLLDLKAAIEGDLAGRYADDRFSNVKALSAAREALAG
jgi:nucleoside-diphosphate-sugar epimerase